MSARCWAGVMVALYWVQRRSIPLARGKGYCLFARSAGLVWQSGPIAGTYIDRYRLGIKAGINVALYVGFLSLVLRD